MENKILKKIIKNYEKKEIFLKKILLSNKKKKNYKKIKNHLN